MYFSSLIIYSSLPSTHVRLHLSYTEDTNTHKSSLSILSSFYTSCCFLKSSVCHQQSHSLLRNQPILPQTLLTHLTHITSSPTPATEHHNHPGTVTANSPLLCTCHCGSPQLILTATLHTLPGGQRLSA